MIREAVVLSLAAVVLHAELSEATHCPSLGDELIPPGQTETEWNSDAGAFAWLLLATVRYLRSDP